MIWHSSDTASVVNELKSDIEKGLDSGIVLERLQKYGKNEIHDFVVPSFWKVLLKRVTDYYNILLFTAALIFFFISLFSESGSFTEPLMIIIAIIINCFVGSFVNYSHMQKVDRLRTSHTTYTRVLRDGTEQVIPSANLVPGDIMLLSSGDFIAADGRLLNSYVFICDEFSVTGETVPIEKTAELILEDIN